MIKRESRDRIQVLTTVTCLFFPLARSCNLTLNNNEEKNQNNAEFYSSKSFLGSDFRTVIYGIRVTIIPTGSCPRTRTLSSRHTELKEFMRLFSSAETRQVH